MNLRGSEREAVTISSTPTLSRRLLLLGALGLGGSVLATACKAAEAALNNRSYVPLVARDPNVGIKPTETSTPTLTPTVTLERTPTPTATPETLSSDWPAEIRTAMKDIILPDTVRLIRSQVTPPGQPNCTRACYMQTKEVWIIDPPLHPNPSPELLALTYELGHGHQQKRREIEAKGTWEETTEYQAFIATRDKVNAILRARGDAEWTQEPYHLFTNIWTGYFMGDPSFKNPPADWNKWVPDPYQPHLIDWKYYMDRWVRQ